MIIINVFIIMKNVLKNNRKNFFEFYTLGLLSYQLIIFLLVIQKNFMEKGIN